MDKITIKQGASLQQIKNAVNYQTDEHGDGKDTSKGKYRSRTIEVATGGSSKPNVVDLDRPGAVKLLAAAFGNESKALIQSSAQDVLVNEHQPVTKRNMRQLILEVEKARTRNIRTNRRNMDKLVHQPKAWSDLVEQAGWSAKMADDESLKRAALAAMAQSPKASTSEFSVEDLKQFASKALSERHDEFLHSYSEAFPNLSEIVKPATATLSRRVVLSNQVKQATKDWTGPKGRLSQAPEETKAAIKTALSQMWSADRELENTEYENSHLLKQKARVEELRQRLSEAIERLQERATVHDKDEFTTGFNEIGNALVEDLTALDGRLELKESEIKERLRDDPSSMRVLWKKRHDIAMGACIAGRKVAKKIDQELEKLKPDPVNSRPSKARFWGAKKNESKNTKKAVDARKKYEDLKQKRDLFLKELEDFEIREMHNYSHDSIPIGFRPENAEKFPGAKIDLNEKPFPESDVTLGDMFSEAHRGKMTLGNEDNPNHPHNAFDESWGTNQVNTWLGDAELLERYKLSSKNNDIKKGWIEARNAPKNSPISKQNFTVTLGGSQSQYELVETPVSKNKTRNARMMERLGMGQRITKDRGITAQEKAGLDKNEAGAFVAPINTRTANLYKVGTDKNGNQIREKTMEIHHHAINDFYDLSKSLRKKANQAAATSVLTEAMENDREWLNNVARNPKADTEMVFVNVNYTNPRWIGDSHNLEKKFTSYQLDSFHAATGQNVPDHPKKGFRVDLGDSEDQKDKDIETKATFIAFQCPNKLEEDSPGSRNKVFDKNKAALSSLVGGLTEGSPIDGKLGKTVKQLEAKLIETAENGDNPDKAAHAKAKQLLGSLVHHVNLARSVFSSHDYLERSSEFYKSDRHAAGRAIGVVTNLWREATELVEAGNRLTRVAYGDNCKSTKDRGPMGAASAMAGKVIADHGQSMEPGQLGGNRSPEQHEVYTALAATGGRNARHQVSVHGSTLVDSTLQRQEVLGAPFGASPELQNAAADIAGGSGINKGQAN